MPSIESRRAAGSFQRLRFGSRICRLKDCGQFQTINGNPSINFFNNAAQCLGLTPGAFTGGQPYTPTQIFGNSDAGFDGSFFSGVGSLRPFNGNSSDPVGTLDF